MTETPTPLDWEHARGEKWRDNLDRMEAMLQPVDAPLISALKIEAPCRIADVGCGGGGTTQKIAKAAPDGSFVCGYDISPALIEAARKRASSNNSHATFEVTNIQTALEPKNKFDRITSRFGTMFYPDPETAFGNLHSWLKPEGRIAFAVWGAPEQNPWMATVRKAVTQIIDLPDAEPDAPGPFRYGHADTLVSLLTKVGFKTVSAANWHGKLPMGGGMNASDAASFALSSFSVGATLLEHSEAAFAQAKDLLTAYFTEHEMDGITRLDASVHMVTGDR